MKNVELFARKKITMEKFTTQVKVSSENKIKKILKVYGKSVIDGVDQANGIVSLSGIMKINVIFENEEQNISNIDSHYEFIEKQQISAELTDTYAVDEITLRSVNYLGNDIICVFEHNVSLSGTYYYEIPDFSDDSSDLVIKKSEIESLKLVTSCSDEFDIAEEMETNITGGVIVSSKSEVILTEVCSLVEKIAVEGKVLSEIQYYDNNGIEVISKEFEFRQEISAVGVIPNQFVTVDCIIKNEDVVFEKVGDNEKLVFNFKLKAFGLVCENQKTEFTEDMFSLKNNLQTTYDFVDAELPVSAKNYSDTVMMSTDVSGIENFDDIVGMCIPQFVLDKIEDCGEKCYVTGNILADAIYKSGEDYETIKTNLPVKFEAGKEKNDIAGRVAVLPEITSFKVKAGKNLEVVYQVNYSVFYNKNINFKFVKSFDSIGEKKLDESGIRVYVASSGENLFEVARSLNVTPELILSQNDVSDVFEQGEKIYVYSPINICK